MLPEQTTEPLTQKNKGMLALVIFLGVLIVVATTVLIFVIVSRLIHKNDHPATVMSTIPTSSVPASVMRPVSVLQEPNGTHITQIFRQSDQMMVISLSGGGLPDRIVMWDVANQQKLSEIKLLDPLRK
ncbi:MULTISPECIES: hypothetical protein [Commensalibacter]|uniref:Uncharacterized protein n=2 Tax=Commensalibacter TaxID=1079922 RepID=W7DZ76_9PROT|nr:MULTISPECIES: hypothetical protein [Commensalibacter]EUK19343.1 hypothetical protein COMX_06315 [Commensalibacter papalotli (ex Servin-Garciduenas et al. 2014)]CAI3933817.1 unnamed protein product [Commensalibacter papalotli (ex Botero et al. 2024)]CAI3949862.1 unnamed protein product [Commensalibacter papalotli (ex Botero et al. 2024)]